MKSDKKKLTRLFRKAELKRHKRIKRCMRNETHSFIILTKTARLTGVPSWVCSNCGNIIQST